MDWLVGIQMGRRWLVSILCIAISVRLCINVSPGLDTTWNMDGQNIDPTRYQALDCPRAPRNISITPTTMTVTTAKYIYYYDLRTVPSCPQYCPQIRMEGT